MDTCTIGRTEDTRGTSPATTSERLEALRGELARQNDALAHAAAQLSAMGNAPVAVPRDVLAAIDDACLVRMSPLTTRAIRA
jgi:hypothetical protein